ncbi:MAG: NYN domain-containing protein [Chloroflexi bacterium]|nr:NYN domain-containing protein [Chloroflexota bacterium]
MHYLIDGHNLIAKLPDISLDDPNDEVELILRLKSWAAASRKRKVTVYFDGGLPGGIEQRLSTSDIKVIFAPKGRTADSLIINRIRKIQNPPEYTLVTSDQQIIAAAQKRRLPHLRSEAFAAKMNGDKQKRAAPPLPLETDDPIVSASEVAEWMTLFGPEPTLPPQTAKRPQQKKSKAPRRKGRRRSPQELKTADGKLNDDEIKEWLNLFNQE